MTEYKITTLKILEQSLASFLYLFTILGLLYFLCFTQLTINPNPNYNRIWFIIIIFVILIYPVVIYPLFIVHNHYKYDQHTIITINKKNKKVFYNNKNTYKDFLVSDITSVKKYTSSRKFYIVYYYEIFLKDETMIRFSSLLMPNLDRIFKDVKYRKERTNDLLLHRKSS